MPLFASRGLLCVCVAGVVGGLFGGAVGLDLLGGAFLVYEFVAAARADAVIVVYVRDPYAAVADLARACCADDRVDGLVAELVTHDQYEHHALDDVGFVHDAAVDTAVAGMARAAHVDLGEPFDAVLEKCLFGLVEPCPTDDRFDLLHKLIC